MYGGKPYPGTLELLLAMQSLEHSKKLLSVLGVKSGAVVFHEHEWRSRIQHLPNFNNGRRPATGELDGVRQQVHKNGARQSCVAMPDWEIPDSPFNLTIFNVSRQLFNRLLYESLYVDGLTRERLARQLAEVQKMCDQRLHPCYAG